MRIAIRVATGLPPELADLTRRRLEFALGRFDRCVRSLTIRLSDVNGPRGGVDQKCLIMIRLAAPKQVIVIEDTDSEMAVAIHCAAARAARAVARAVHAVTDWRSGRRRPWGGRN